MFPSLTSETAMIPELSQPNRKFFLRCTSQMAPTGPCPGLGNSRTCLFLLRKHAHLSLAAYSWRTSPSLPYTHPPPTLWQIEVSVKTGNFDIILELIRHQASRSHLGPPESESVFSQGPPVIHSHSSSLGNTVLAERLVKIFHNGPDGKYFTLQAICLCRNYSTLLLQRMEQPQIICSQISVVIWRGEGKLYGH